MTRYFVFLVLVVCFLSLPRVAMAEREGEYFRYGEFIDMVRNGEVVSVQLDEFSQISGVYKEGDTEKAFHTYREDPPNDLLLLSLLREKAVRIQIREEDRSALFPLNLFAGILMFGIPLVTLAYVFSINSKLKRLLSAEGKIAGQGSHAVDSSAEPDRQGLEDYE